MVRLAAALAAALVLSAAAAAAQPGADGADLFVPLPGGATLRLNDLDLGDRDAAMATPLHRVAETVADPALVRAMLARGADPRARDAQGRTPLHAAAAAGAPVGVVAALLGGGADPDARDAHGRTALHLAATPAAAGVLALAGADPCATTPNGAAALSPQTLEAVRRDAPEAYPALVEAFLSCL